VQTENGSSVSFGGSLFDAELELPCTARLFDDGIFRCTPNTGFSSGYFSDSSCEVPLHHEPTCSEPRYVAEEAYSEECGIGVTAISALYRVGTTYEGEVYVLNEEGCALVDVPPGPLVTLEPVAPSELVSLTEEVE
jgi:hypothetical protein